MGFSSEIPDMNNGRKMMQYKLDHCTRWYDFTSRDKDHEQYILIQLGRDICIYGDTTTMATAMEKGLRKEHIELAILAQYDRLPLLQYCHEHMKLQTTDYCQQEGSHVQSVFAMAAIKDYLHILRWLADTLSFTPSSLLWHSLTVALQEAKNQNHPEAASLVEEMLSTMNSKH